MTYSHAHVYLHFVSIAVSVTAWHQPLCNIYVWCPFLLLRQYRLHALVVVVVVVAVVAVDGVSVFDGVVLAVAVDVVGGNSVSVVVTSRLVSLMFLVMLLMFPVDVS